MSPGPRSRTRNTWTRKTRRRCVLRRFIFRRESLSVFDEPFCARTCLQEFEDAHVEKLEDVPQPARELEKEMPEVLHGSEDASPFWVRFVCSMTRARAYVRVDVSADPVEAALPAFLVR